MRGGGVTDDGFDVVGCRECEQLWILNTVARETLSRIECPVCGHARDPRKVRVLGHTETREGADKVRSCKLAARADEVENYSEFVSDNSQYADQADEVERRLNGLAPDFDPSSWKTIGEDKFAELAESVHRKNRSKFEEWAEEYSGLYTD